MNAYVLSAKSYVDGQIDAYHFNMFHGLCERSDVSRPSNPCHFWGDDVTQPLLISRNCYNLPDVFLPSTSLIISEAVRTLLSGADVQVSEIRFAKLFNEPYAMGDYSYQDRLEVDESFFSYVDYLVDEPDLHKTVGMYYEVLAKNLYRCGRAQAKVKLPKDDGYIYEPVSLEVLDTYPVCWSQAGVIIRESEYCKMHDRIDRAFFYVNEIRW